MNSEREKESRIHLLLLTSFFPPANTMAAHRMFSFAEYLPQHGIDVTVVTVEREGTLHRDPSAADVIRLYRDTSPVNRFVRRRSLLRKLYHTSCLRPLRNYYRGPFAKAFIRFCRTHSLPHFDAVLASYGPEDVLRAGEWLHRNTGTPLILDFRDPWLDNLAYAWTFGERKIIEALQRRLLKSASLVVTVSKTWAEDLRRYIPAYGDKVVVVYNGYFEDARYSEAKLQGLASAQGSLKACYCGSLYGGLRALDVFLFGMQQCRDVHLYLAVLDETDVEVARDLVHRTGLEEQVTILTSLSHEESLALQKECDILLLLNRTDGTTKGLLQGKLYEYFSTGKFVLGIGHPEDEAAQLVARYGNGAYVSDPSGVAHVLRSWPAHQRKPKAMTFFSRRNQAQILAGHIKARLSHLSRTGSPVAGANSCGA